MKIIFNSNKYIRVLVAINNLFGPEDSIAQKMLIDPRFFGKEIYLATKIYEKLKINLKEFGVNSFWVLFLDRNISDAKRKFPDLIENLNQLSTILNFDDILTNKISNQINQDFKILDSNINVLLNKFFAFKLPDEIDIIIDYDTIASFTGSSLSYSPLIISIQMPKYSNKIITISLHEILHSLINKNKNIPEDKYRFEEALLDYFAPNGIIDEKLELLDSFKIEERFESLISNRPYAINEAKELLPIIKEYCEMSDKITIWEFLKKSGFSFINI